MTEMELPEAVMESALCVMVLDQTIREWLKEHDPKAFEQAVAALRFYHPPLLRGRCRICGYYGEDCLASRRERLLDE